MLLRRLINSPINVSCWNSLRICIDGCTFGWIRSFLYDWDKTVGLEGKSSSTKPVTSGITHTTVKELCLDRCCSLCRTTICLNEYSHHTPDYSQMIGNSSGLCPSIHISANCCVSPAISLQWMSPKRRTVSHTNRSFHCQLHVHWCISS